jgi:hypothetical protein
MGIDTDRREVYYVDCDNCGERLEPITDGPDLFGKYGFLNEWCEEQPSKDIEKWLRIGGIEYEDKDNVKLFCPECKHDEDAKEALKEAGS